MNIDPFVHAAPPLLARKRCVDVAANRCTPFTVTVIANWVGKVGSNSIFIKSVGVAYLPIAYVIAPIVLLVASSVIFMLVSKMRRRDLFIWYVGIVAVLSLAAQVLLPVTSTDYWFTYVLAQVVKDSIYLIFWVYAGNLFDSEQSKRIFPVFAGSLLVGKIVGGFMAAALTPGATLPTPSPTASTSPEASCPRRNGKSSLMPPSR